MLSRFAGRALAFFRHETVLCVAALLAVLSTLLVPPDAAYAGYIDLRTLAILFSLMTVMAGLQAQGVFAHAARSILRGASTLRRLFALMTALTFFFSMFITNDVALIALVPLSVTTLGLLDPAKTRSRLVPLSALQTVAANLGSMLTPMGNPQNLYLYGLSGMGFGEFILLMLPYSAASLALLLVWCCLCCRGRNEPLELHAADEPQTPKRGLLAMYALLFVVSLLAVARLLPYPVALAAVLLAALAFDRGTLLRVDYSLLFTFAAFFVFVGNMGRVGVFHDVLRDMLASHELLTAVAASQVISNVPAALLLSGFTDNVRPLIVGTNLGGLGTLIASMASLISFKCLAAFDKSLRGRYIVYFTLMNAAFLALLLGLCALIAA